MFSFSKKLHLSLLGIFSLVISANSHAIVAIPSDLSAGDQYRLVFVTDAMENLLGGGGTLNGTLNNTSYYNNFVTTQANQSSELAALGADWFALYSTSFLDARDNAGINHTIDATGVPIYLVNDVRVADTNNQFWAADNFAPINVTQSGAVVGTERIWTATRVSGIWQSPTHSPSRDAFGLSNQVNAKHFIGSNVNELTRTSLHRFYGISEVLTVSNNVPTPGSLLLLLLGVVGFLVRKQHAA